MASKPLCPKYQYITLSKGPQLLPFDQPACKDEESPADYNAGGYLPVKVNDTFKQGRYRVVRKLGWGHFSTVWLVKDSETGAHSALKVVKSAGRYAETARDEIKLLSRVASVSPNHPGRSYIVSFLDSFSHQSPESAHICIVFEPLGENLLALIERNKKKGVPRVLVKVIAKQILLGLQYLHDECDLVHTDIKPENILISIPDIEEHINQELLQSPSPTSRRVGVPLPGKSKAGVTIPYTQQQRARRQVQIFESQPLSSPSRSLARSLGRNSNGGHSNLLMSSRAPGSVSATASQSNSYVTQMNFLRNSSNVLSSSNNIAGGSLGSRLSKAHGNSTTSLPALQQQSVAKVEPSPPTNAKAPSTASSSSSVSSAAVSTPAGGSIISTPPTSLSQSMTGSGFLNKVDLKGLYIVDEMSGSCSKGIPIQLKGRDRDGLSPGSSLSKPASWVDHIPGSLSSSCKGSPLKSSKPRSSRHGHSHSQSGVVNAPWQVPSAASPAPVVLVNAVVGADGQDSGLVAAPMMHTSCSSTSTVTLSQSASESPSTAATVTQPSPTGTPLGTRKTKTMSIINGVSKLISDTSNMFSSSPHSTSDLKPPVSSGPIEPSPSPANPISLLTQTAPTRITTTPASPSERSSQVRPSPPQHTSQLSAHMHIGPCHSLNASSGLAEAAQRPPTSSRRSSRPNITTAIPLHRHDVSPAPPPPTPIDGPQLGSFSTHEYDTLPAIDTSGKSYAPNPTPISIKIADLGNATPSKKHYTEDIQTRQYRAPEAIVGRKDWDARADIWSVACLVFELLASEYLFDPQGQGELFTKDDDHMAQIIELVGDFSLDVKMGGKYSRELFDHSGALRYIKTLKPWPLRRVMTEKYLYAEDDADSLCAFLLPMLKADWRERANARDMLDHPWLDISNDEEVAEW